MPASGESMTRAEHAQDTDRLIRGTVNCWQQGTSRAVIVTNSLLCNVRASDWDWD